MRDIRLDIRRIRMSRGSQPYVRSYKRDELEPTYRSLTGENGACNALCLITVLIAVGNPQGTCGKQ